MSSFAGIAQLVEQGICNAKVVSSNLIAGTTLKGEMIMEWNVLWDDPNAHKIVVRNVFKLSVRFNEELDRLRNMVFKSFDDFSTELRHSVMYCYWGKCEYEITVCPYPYNEKYDEERKIDVYDQLRLNWDLFATYVYDNLWEAADDE